MYFFKIQTQLKRKHFFAEANTRKDKYIHTDWQGKFRILSREKVGISLKFGEGGLSQYMGGMGGFQDKGRYLVNTCTPACRLKICHFVAKLETLSWLK